MPTQTYFETVPIAELIENGLNVNAKSAGTTPTLTAVSQPGFAARAGTRVLVVDDERVIADTLVAILNQHGFVASAAYSGESASELLQQGAPDLLITDVSMPGMNGVELAIVARDLWPKCKILLFSGHAATTNLIAQARSRGYDFQLLTKPIHPRDLLEKLSA